MVILKNYKGWELSGIRNIKKIKLGGAGELVDFM